MKSLKDIEELIVVEQKILTRIDITRPCLPSETKLLNAARKKLGMLYQMKKYAETPQYSESAIRSQLNQLNRRVKSINDRWTEKAETVKDDDARVLIKRKFMKELGMPAIKKQIKTVKWLLSDGE